MAGAPADGARHILPYHRATASTPHRIQQKTQPKHLGKRGKKSALRHKHLKPQRCLVYGTPETTNNPISGQGGDSHQGLNPPHHTLKAISTIKMDVSRKGAPRAAVGFGKPLSMHSQPSQEPPAMILAHLAPHTTKKDQRSW